MAGSSSDVSVKKGHRLYACNAKALLAACVLTAAALIYVYAGIEEYSMRLSANISDLSTVFEDFTVDTIGGGTFSSDDVHSHTLTVLNTWNTGCGPCIDEMPVLNKLNGEYAEKGVQIIGLCCDVVDDKAQLQEANLKSAKDIIASCGAEYPQIIASPEINSNYVNAIILAYPTTLFLDSDGKVLDIITGASDEAGWRERIDKELEKAAGGAK